MLPRNHPDRIRIVFDDHRLVANAGLLLPTTLARHLGLRELVDHHLDLGGAPGRANTGDKLMTLVASAMAGGDCIDDADVLRTGGTACTLGGTPTQRPRKLAPAQSATASCRVLSRHLALHSHCRPPSVPPKAPADRPSTQIRARIIAPVTPSPPSAVLTPSIPVLPWIRV